MRGRGGRKSDRTQTEHPTRRVEQARRIQRVNKSFQPNHLSIRLHPEKSEIPTSAPGEKEYAMEKLMVVKTRLNGAKSKLDIYDNLSKVDTTECSNFQQFQNIVDLYKPMRFEIQKNYNAKFVTNAWMKYWELYSQYEVVPKKIDRKFVAFFNAELPGAAMCAFNHFMHTQHPNVDFDWRASSLAPGETTTENLADALGDVYGLFANNRDKWLMTLPDDKGSRKNNGDVTDLENIKDFAKLLGPESEFGGVDFYSHDAGINVADDYNNQELANAKIHLGCALAGFLTLREGGTFIAKQYTFFETFTWNLIIIYAQLFDEFYICKPLTSRPYNSEIYLVGKGFRGLPKATEQLLADRLQKFNTLPFIPADAINVQLGDITAEICRFARIVFIQQAQFIEENVTLYESYKTKLIALKKGIAELKHDLAYSWLKKYPVGQILDKDQLPSN